MAKAKALPKDVIGYREFFNKLINEPDSLGLILIYGEEQYLIDGAVKTAKKKYISDGGDIDYSIIDTRTGDDFSFSKLEEMTSMPPWMSSRRLVIIKQSGIMGKEIDDKDLDVLKNIPSSAVVIFIEDSADSRKKIFKAFAKYGTVVQMSAMEQDDISARIRKMFFKSELSIDENACLSLISRCGGNMLTITGEITKITLYCQNAGIKRVNEDVIEECCPPDISGRIFDIMDACGSQNPAKALGTLNNLILAREEPVIMIRVAVINHLKRLIMAKELNNAKKLAAETGAHEYYAGKLITQASRFSMNRLISTYLAACQSDSDVKHGLIDERFALEIILVRAATAEKNN